MAVGPKVAKALPAMSSAVAAIPTSKRKLNLRNAKFIRDGEMRP